VHQFYQTPAEASVWIDALDREWFTRKYCSRLAAIPVIPLHGR
jgi:hypothetical protein